MSSLDADLLAAHAKGDSALLAKLYAQAAETQEPASEQAAFYLTHAYVFALEVGMDEAKTYHAQLKSWGREE